MAKRLTNKQEKNTFSKLPMVVSHWCDRVSSTGIRFINNRDLKPANIMIKNNILKIGDFGFAKKSEAASKVKNHTIVGSPLYMSLQILKS